MMLNQSQLRQSFEQYGYIASEEVIMTIFLALSLEKPLLIEGAPGVGKTEIAKVLSSIFNTDLIRLQCYEGLDENRSLYEWNYQRQLLKIQLHKESAPDILEKSLFDVEYLLERPLLQALTAPKKVVLLIDEIDKTDDQFEAFLFEVLSDFQVSIPEMGTVMANHIPIVVLTSNHERELSDGLLRRCIYMYIDYPSLEKEVAILERKIPDLQHRLAREIAAALAVIRHCSEIEKKPAVSEALDWARALVMLGAESIDANVVAKTLGILLKREEDIRYFNEHIQTTLYQKLKVYLQQEREA